MKKFLLAIPACLIACSSWSQITVAPAGTPAQIGTFLTGNGVTISNVIVNGDTSAYGYFTAINTSLGMNGGLLLTNGDISNVIGPNNSPSIGTCNGSTGTDPQLVAIEPQGVYNTCRIQFDCVPSDDTLYFNFLFGSEEYPEFVNASFNDVFGIFITGGIYNNTNIGTLPNGVTPVSIDNVNAGNNSSFYIDNTGDTNLQYDGSTVNIQVQRPVTPNVTYSIKIAIADAGDCIYDSGVFLQAGSFRCSGQPLDVPAPVLPNEHVMAYPVPASSTLNFSFSTLTNENVDIVFYSLDGKAVLAHNSQAVNNVVSVDVSSLAKGTYLAEVVHDGVRETKRVVISE